MTEVHRCPQCGSTLPADAPEGVCPRCVLALGLDGRPPLAAAAIAAPASSPQALAPTTPATPSGRFQPPKPDELAPLFPQLEILDLLGQGGMGAVYKARQTKLDRLVALKILPPEVSQDPAFAERFAREARTLGRLSHPQIVAIHDFGQAGNLYYLVMEFVDGQNLRQLIASGTLAPQEALAIVPKICEALQYAHDEGVVHRDIKPENILLDKKGRVKIADFGLAKLLGRPAGSFTLTDTHQVMGTPHYMAPEQVQGSRAVDHRADIYSLGVVFYEMLTGELPLGLFEPPSKKASIDVRLDEVVLRALERSPERRYQHVSEVKTDLETISRVSGPLPSGSAGAFTAAREEPVGVPDSIRGEFENSVALMFCVSVVGIVANLILAWVMWPAAFSRWPVPGNNWFTYVMWHVFVAGIPIGLFGCTAAILMARLRAYYLVKAAAFLLMLPWSFAVIMGLPAGFWMFFILLPKPEVRRAFAAAAKSRALSGGIAREAISPADSGKDDEEKLAEARFLVRGPAIGLMVVGAVAWIQSWALWLKNWDAPQNLFHPRDLPMTTLAALGIPYGALMLVTGWQLIRLRTYTLGVLTGILAYVVPLGLLPLIAWPVAIWTHVVLWKQVVCDAFAIHLRQRIRAARSDMLRKPSPSNYGELIAQVTARFSRTKVWILLLALMGLATVIMPWYSFQCVHRQGGYGTIPAAMMGLTVWHALLTGFAALVLVTVTLGLPRSAEKLKSAVAIGIGLLIVMVSIHFFLWPAFPRGGVPGPDFGRSIVPSLEYAVDLWFGQRVAQEYDIRGVGPYIGPFVALPIGLGLVLLGAFRLRTATRGDNGLADPPAAAVKAPRGTLGRAWDAWWGERDRWFTNVVQSILAIVAVGCLILYLNFHLSSEATPGDAKLRHTTIEVGFPAPWFHLEKYPEPHVPFRWTINYFASSSLVMLLGCAAWYAYWQIEKAKPEPKWLWLGSPNTMILFWGILSATIAVSAMLLDV